MILTIKQVLEFLVRPIETQIIQQLLVRQLDIHMQKNYICVSHYI